MTAVCSSSAGSRLKLSRLDTHGQLLKRLQRSRSHAQMFSCLTNECALPCRKTSARASESAFEPGAKTKDRPSADQRMNSLKSGLWRR